MTPFLRLQIDASDAYGDYLRAALAFEECKPDDRPTRKRVLADRLERWMRAAERLAEAESQGRAA